MPLAQNCVSNESLWLQACSLLGDGEATNTTAASLIGAKTKQRRLYLATEECAQKAVVVQQPLTDAQFSQLQCGGYSCRVWCPTLSGELQLHEAVPSHCPGPEHVGVDSD